MARITAGKDLIDKVQGKLAAMEKGADPDFQRTFEPTVEAIPGSDNAELPPPTPKQPAQQGEKKAWLPSTANSVVEPAPEPEVVEEIPEIELPAEEEQLPDPAPSAEAESEPFARVDVDGLHMEVPSEEEARNLMAEGLRARSRQSEPQVSEQDQRLRRIGELWTQFQQRDPDTAARLSRVIDGQESLDTPAPAAIPDEDLTDAERLMMERLQSLERENQSLKAQVTGISSATAESQLRSQLEGEIAKYDFLKGGRDGARSRRALAIAAETMRTNPGVGPKQAVMHAAAEIRDLVTEQAEAQVKRQQKRARTKAESPAQGSPAVKAPPKKPKRSRHDLKNGRSVQRIFQKAVQRLEAGANQIS